MAFAIQEPEESLRPRYISDSTQKRREATDSQLVSAMEMQATMSSLDPATAERRRWPRQSIPGGMKVELLLHVSGTNPAVLLMHGVARDISYGGMSCAVDLAVPKGTSVSVRLSDLPDGAMAQPETIAGRVVRTEPMGGILGRMAIEFEEPLHRLDLTHQEPMSTVVSYPGPDTALGTGFGCATTFGRVFR